jgi:hypothetical protein
MFRPMMMALLAGVIIAIAASRTALGAELQIPPAAHARQYQQAISCGPCGCLHVTWTYHRVLLSTYGLGFDPRNFDTTQPFFHYGALRAYPHFWCEINAAQ